MITYLCLYIVLLSFSLMSDRIKEKKLIFILLISCLFWVSTLRSFEIGADYNSYVEFFERYKTGADYPYKYGFEFLNWIAVHIGGRYTSLAFIVNIFIFGLTFWTYQKALPDKYLLFAVVIWFLNPYCFIQSTFNMLRQGCAMALVTFAFYILHEKKKQLGFFVIVGLAALFHKSACVFLMLFIILKIKWSRRQLLLLSASCIALNVLFKNSIFMLQIARLLRYDDYVKAFGGSIFDNLAFTILIAVWIIILLSYYPCLFMDELEKKYVDVYIVSLAALLLLVKNDQAYRLYVYFSFITVISSVIIIKNMIIKYGRIGQLIRYGYLAYFSGLYWGFLILQQMNGNTRYVPFKFFV